MSAALDSSPSGRLGAFIKAQRTLAALSQRELAKLANLSDPYVSQLERGLHEPSVKVLKALARALNVRAETMLAYAGWLEDHAGGGATATAASDVEAAVRADPDLDREAQEAVLAVYRAFKDRART
jgi:transcriptional regulator with XRE-family HTH domain